MKTTQQQFTTQMAVYHFTNGAKPCDHKTTEEAVRAMIAGYFFVCSSIGKNAKDDFAFDVSDWDDIAQDVANIVNSEIDVTNEYDVV